MTYDLLEMVFAQIILWFIAGNPTPWCDNRQPLFLDDGSPNPRCAVDGCTFFHQTCWEYRLTDLGCYDKDENLVCEVETLECANWFACASLWFNCEGQWTCTDPDGICDEGVCETPSGGSAALVTFATLGVP